MVRLLGDSCKMMAPIRLDRAKTRVSDVDSFNMLPPYKAPSDRVTGTNDCFRTYAKNQLCSRHLAVKREGRNLWFRPVLRHLAVLHQTAAIEASGPSCGPSPVTSPLPRFAPWRKSG